MITRHAVWLYGAQRPGESAGMRKRKGRGGKRGWLGSFLCTQLPTHALTIINLQQILSADICWLLPVGAGVRHGRKPQSGGQPSQLHQGGLPLAEGNLLWSGEVTRLGHPDLRGLAVHQSFQGGASHPNESKIQHHLFAVHLLQEGTAKVHWSAACQLLKQRSQRQ